MKFPVFLGAVLCMQHVACQHFRLNPKSMVAVMTKRTKFVESKLLCGGAIIDDLWVLTAAQCTINQNISTIHVKAGSVYLKFTKPYHVVEIHDHPSYDSIRGIHDISLIKVERSMTRNASRAIKIPYATNVEKHYEDIGVSIAGWGLLSVSIKCLCSTMFKQKYVILCSLIRNTVNPFL